MLPVVFFFLITTQSSQDPLRRQLNDIGLTVSPKHPLLQVLLLGCYLPSKRLRRHTVVAFTYIEQLLRYGINRKKKSLLDMIQRQT
jgi:hypothetical protein